MRFMYADLVLPSGERTLYACMFVIDSKGDPILYENWGPAGYNVPTFLCQTQEKFNKRLFHDGLPRDMEYDDWKTATPVPQKRGRGEAA